MAAIPDISRNPNYKPIQRNFWQRAARDLTRNKWAYLLLVPVLAYYLIFHYGPMYGTLIAFQDYNPIKGIFGSPWIGFENFRDFFSSVFFGRLLTNTILINLMDLVFGFPAPILLALLLNEVRWEPFKRLVQTISYMPHFISVVVVVGMMVDFFARDGLVNNMLKAMMASPTSYMQDPNWFRQLFVGSGIWQSVGWSSIIYMAALSNIDPSLYEAAMVDGAGRFRQLLHITLPGLLPTITILLILRLGSMMTVGYEKIILMYNPLTYSTADVISTYVYRRGILNTDFSFSAAVGLFNSIINFALVVGANTLSRKYNETSLW
jgi:putative aldouronate transport system permease protein